MTLENVCKEIYKANPAAIMITIEEDDHITSKIWGRMDKESFYAVLEDAVAQYKEEKAKAFDEFKDQLPF